MAFRNCGRFSSSSCPTTWCPPRSCGWRRLPLTPNGKLDRQALPEPGRARPEFEKRCATPRDTVEIELARIWEEVLAIQTVGIEDKFFELGGHSLLAVRVIAQIEKQFGRRLKLATIFQAQTIEHLAAILRKEIQEDSALAATSLVEIQPKGSRRPLFFVHGAGGGMFWGYVNLSRHLGQDHPVYGLRSRGLDGREEFATIEEMAAQYIRDIQAIQPRGPYQIGGYCFGGNVAYEMARQLEGLGEEIAMLALLNCAPANSRYSQLRWSPRWLFRFGVNLCYWARYFLDWTPAQRREFFRWKKEMLKRRADRFLGHTAKSKATVDAGELVDLSSYSEEERKLWESHIRALVNYHPKPFEGRVHLFRSPGHPLLCSFDDDYGWGDLARGGVEITVVPGVHEKILEEPNVQSLATELSRSLDQATHSSALSHPADWRNPVPKLDPALAQWNRTRVKFSIGPALPASFRGASRSRAAGHGAKVRRRGIKFRGTQRAGKPAGPSPPRGLGSEPETLVAVALNRSLHFPTALLAIWKAGGAFLPLDPSYPAERLAFMAGRFKRRPAPDSKRSGLAAQCSPGHVVPGQPGRAAAHSKRSNPQPGLQRHAGESGLRHLHLRLNGHAQRSADHPPRAAESQFRDR